VAEIHNFRLVRVLVAIVVAELLPILLLVAIVMVYAFASDQTRPDSMKPEEFAPIAGNWVGPIGGFIATMCLSLWAARVVPKRALYHGFAVGAGAAMLDFSIAVLIGGGEVSPLLVFSNCGRVLAGLLGGFVASRQRGESFTEYPVREQDDHYD
jgi:hypothetical protein